MASEDSAPTTNLPSHHTNKTKSGFKNPWPSAAPPSWYELTSVRSALQWAKSGLSDHPKARDIQVVKPDWGEGSSKLDGKGKGKGKGKSILTTWLGHATAFIEFPLTDDQTLKLLFDPVFSFRAGPAQGVGVSRLHKSPCQVEDLPGCDAVFISHNHYDHLDLPTILALTKKYPEAHYFVPLGNKSWFRSTGILEEKLHEMDWWEDEDFTPSDFGFSDSSDSKGATSKVRFTCVPAQHNSGRSVGDQSSTLWCGWTCERFVSSIPNVGEDAATARVTRKGAAFFAGDTGYRRYPHSEEVCPAFEELGQKMGPFDVSLVPIWRGGTLGFLSWGGWLRLSHADVPATFHGTPSDAVSIHLDVKSRNTIAIHFGTFIGDKSESLEAVIELKEACEEAEVIDLDDSRETEKGRMGVLDIGETLVVDIEDLAIFS